MFFSLGISEIHHFMVCSYKKMIDFNLDIDDNCTPCYVIHAAFSYESGILRQGPQHVRHLISGPGLCLPLHLQVCLTESILLNMAGQLIMLQRDDSRSQVQEKETMPDQKKLVSKEPKISTSYQGKYLFIIISDIVPSSHFAPPWCWHSAWRMCGQPVAATSRSATSWKLFGFPVARQA